MLMWGTVSIAPHFTQSPALGLLSQGLVTQLILIFGKKKKQCRRKMSSYLLWINEHLTSLAGRTWQKAPFLVVEN